jgi:hypothetical protein
MERQGFNFEIKDLLTQFLAAFDGTVIKRYDKNRVPREDIEVRYVLAPKQRVMYDIVNKAQNLTLPVVAVNITSITRDPNRVFNKLDSYYNSIEGTRSITSNTMPVPIDIKVNMSILTRYLQDMDQIISNFVPYNNPYIIISWKEPTSITSETREIRTEVLWDGNISLTEPIELTSSDKIRIVADTSFTIKGWLFRGKNEISSQIFFIDNNFIPLRGDLIITDRNYDTFFSSLSEITETISLSGFPTITDAFYFTPTNTIQPLLSDFYIEQFSQRSILFYGSFYDRTTNVLLSSSSLSSLTNTLCTLSAKYSGNVTGYQLNTTDFSILNDNMLSINFPTLPLNQSFKIVIANPAGWVASDFTFTT